MAKCSYYVQIPATLLILLSFFCLCPVDKNNLINIFRSPTMILTHVRTNAALQALLVPTSYPGIAIGDSKRSMEHEKTSLQLIEYDLAKARQAIREAVRMRNYTSDKQENFIPRGSIYRNSYAFHQSHIEMEKIFKVWVYREGDIPLFHSGPMNNIYSIEGQFIDEMQTVQSNFIASHPDEAHAFFIPISVAHIVKYIYTPLVTYSRVQLQSLAIDYVHMIANKYPYWNTSQGADHFFVSCHDWGPDISKSNPALFKNFMRALCNANTSEGFQSNRDISIPEINILNQKTLNPPHVGLPPHSRPILAFFAGGAHGHIREMLLSHWKGKDNDIQVHEYLKPKDGDYFQLMGRSKFCLCPSGYEVASPRIVASLHVGCVPVIISDNYSLPFSDVLDWSMFSIHIPSKRIPEIKNILEGIPQKRYLEIQKRVTQVHRHFVVNRPSQPYDMIHMILHSIWLRRLNIRLANY